MVDFKVGDKVRFTRMDVNYSPEDKYGEYRRKAKEEMDENKEEYSEELEEESLEEENLED